MPRSERKKHTSLTLTQGELEAIDRFAEMVGPGTYRNEAVVEAVRVATGVYQRGAPIQPGESNDRSGIGWGNRHPVMGERVVEKVEE